MLIFTFNVLVNNSIAAANGKNVQPLDIPNVEDNDIISMPFLKQECIPAPVTVQLLILNK